MDKISGENGFTLLEILITIVIITIFFIPLASKITNEVGTISESKQKTQALSLGRQVINEIKEVAKKDASNTADFEDELNKLFDSNDWNGLQRNDDASTIWNEIEPPNDINNTDYTIKVNFLDSSADGDLKEVTVRVEWEIKEDGAMVTESEKLTTLITRR